MKKQSNFLIFLCFSLLIQFSIQDISFNSNALRVISPSVSSNFHDEGTKIIVKFSITSAFSLHSQEFLSVYIRNIGFSGNKDHFTCQMSYFNRDNTSENEVLIESASDNDSLSNKGTELYCRILDKHVISGNYDLTLTIKIKTFFSASKFSYVNFIISSSNTVNKVIKYSKILKSNELIYLNNSFQSSIFEFTYIEQENLTSNSNYCPSPCKTIYPNSNIQLTFHLVFHKKVSLVGVNSGRLVLSFNVQSSEYDFSNISISSSNYFPNNLLNNNSLFTSLSTTGQLTLVPFQSNGKSFEIQNINEDILPGRRLSITLSGIKSLNKISSSINSNIYRSISLSLFSKSTLTLISDSQSLPILNILPFPIWFSPNNSSSPPSNWKGISHPEFFDIYENSSWPIKFIVSLPPLPNGGYFTLDVLLSNTNLLNFISSTCDFSDNINTGYIDNTLGNRPLCYPLYNSLPSEISSSMKMGMYFKLPSSVSTKTIAFTVWSVVLKCSQNKFEEYSNPIAVNIYNTNERSKNSGVFSFTYKIFSNITQSNQSSENELFNSKDLLAKWENVTMFGTCFGNTIFYGNPSSSSSISNYYTDQNYISSTKDVLLFKEYHDFNISSKSTSSSFAFTDQTKIKFLYDSSNTNTDFEFGIETISILNTPLPIYLTGINPYTVNYLTSHITLQLSRNFLTPNQSTPGVCYMKWLNSDQTDVSSTGGNNIISTSLTDSSQKINSLLSNLNPSLQTDTLSYYPPVKITSDTLSSTNSVGKSIFPASISSSSLGFTSNCFSFTLQSGSIKSIYSYIDYTYTFTREIDASNKFVNRVGRFIKLNMSSGGVFNPQSNTINISNNLNRYYYVFGKEKNEDVCILKINKNLFVNLKNTLLLCLVNIKLLHTDAEDFSNEYPLSNLSDSNSQKAYGLSTIYPFSHLVSNDVSGMLNSYSSNSHSYISSTFNSDDRNDYVNPRNDYYNYFGSLVFINKISASTVTANNEDLFVPVYCPVEGKSSFSYINPSISMISFDLTSSSLMNVSSQGFFNFQFTYTTPSLQTEKGYLQLLIPRNTYEGLVDNQYNNVSTFFSSYSSSSVEINKRIYVKGGLDTKCNAMLLLLSNEISVLPNEITYIQDGITGLYNKLNDSVGKSFYYKSKKYNKYILKVSQNDSSPTEISSISGNSYFNGVVRSEISTLSTESVKDKFAFTCYLYDSLALTSLTDSGKGRFFNSDQSSLSRLSSDNSQWSVVVDMESSSQVFYSSDKGSKIKITIGINHPLPSKGKLMLKSSIFNNSNTICGIESSTFPLIANDQCQIDILNQKIVCELSHFGILSSQASSSFTICCHNLVATTDEIILLMGSKVYLNTENEELSYLNSNFSSGYYQLTGTEPNINTLIPIVEDYKFLYTSQMNGIGALVLKINLKRPALANQVIRLKSGLNQIFINSFEVRCKFTYSDAVGYELIEYGSDYTNRDYLVDKCVYNNVEKSFDIYNKNFIYKCGLTISSNLILTIYPVSIKNLNSLSVNTYSIYSGLSSFNNESLLTSPPKTTNLDVFSQFNFQPNQIVPIHSSVSLCNLTKIDNEVIGEVGKYTFIWNFQSLPSVIQNKEPNELIIFLDKSLFKLSPSANCSINSQSAQCDHDQFGFLSIRLSSNSRISTLSNNPNGYLILIIDGIINPDFSLIHTFSLLCSVNFYSSTSSLRENILLGTGTIQVNTVFQSNFSQVEQFDLSSNRKLAILLNGTSSPYDLILYDEYNNIQTIQSMSKIIYLFNSNNQTIGSYDLTMKSNFQTALSSFPSVSPKEYLSYIVDTQLDDIKNYSLSLLSLVIPGIYIIFPNNEVIVYNPYNSLTNTVNYQSVDISSFITSSFETYFEFTSSNQVNIDYKIYKDLNDTTFDLVFVLPSDLKLKLASLQLALVLMGNTSSQYSKFLNIAYNIQNRIPCFICNSKECLEDYKVPNGSIVFMDNSNSQVNEVYYFNKNQKSEEIIFYLLDKERTISKSINASMEKSIQFLNEDLPILIICLANSQFDPSPIESALISYDVRIIYSKSNTENDRLIREYAGCSYHSSIGNEVFYIKSKFPFLKYKMTPSSLIVSEIVSFYLNTNAQPIVSSESVPEYSLITTQVKPLVNSNFSSMVYNNNYDIVVIYTSFKLIDIKDFDTNKAYTDLSLVADCFGYEENLLFYRFDVVKNTVVDSTVKPDLSPIIRLYSIRNSKLVSYDYYEYVNGYNTSRESIRDFIRRFSVYDLDLCSFSN